MATPQPGALAGPLVPNSLPMQALCGPRGWPDLPAEQAPNFVRAKPCVLLRNQVLFRVWGGSAEEIGEYWSFTRHSTADKFYGLEAVKLSWNDGSKLAQVHAGKLVRLRGGGGPSRVEAVRRAPNRAPRRGYLVLPRCVRAWVGPAARQGADDTDGNPLPTSEWHLPGGGIHVWIPRHTLSVQPNPTPWSNTASLPPFPTFEDVIATVPDPRLATVLSNHHASDNPTAHLLSVGKISSLPPPAVRAIMRLTSRTLVVHKR